MRRPCESRCSDPGCCWKGSYLRRRCRPSDGSAGPYWQSEARIGEAAVPGPPLSTIDDPDGDCLDEECFDLPGLMSSNDEGGVDEPEPSRPRAQGDRPGLAHEWSVLLELVGSSEESGLDEPEPPRRRMQLPEQGSRPARKTKKAARTNCGEFCLSCKKSCVKFAGARPGFAFKTGMSGVGYYPDGGGAVACADGLAQSLRYSGSRGMELILDVLVPKEVGARQRKKPKKHGPRGSRPKEAVMLSFNSSGEPQ